MTNYRKGYNFEMRVKKIFDKFGFKAERKAASSPYDIVVMKNGKIIFVADAKKTSQKNKNYVHVKKEDVNKIINESKKLNTEPLLIYSFYRKPIYVEFPKDLKLKGRTIRLEEGIKLENFLMKWKNV